MERGMDQGPQPRPHWSTAYSGTARRPRRPRPRRLEWSCTGGTTQPGCCDASRRSPARRGHARFVRRGRPTRRRSRQARRRGPRATRSIPVMVKNGGCSWSVQRTSSKRPTAGPIVASNVRSAYQLRCSPGTGGMENGPVRGPTPPTQHHPASTGRRPRRPRRRRPPTAATKADSPRMSAHGTAPSSPEGVRGKHVAPGTRSQQRAEQSDSRASGHTT